MLIETLLAMSKRFLKRLLPQNLVKLEMALEQLNKVWLNKRVRVSPYRKFFPMKK